MDGFMVGVKVTGDDVGSLDGEREGLFVFPCHVGSAVGDTVGFLLGALVGYSVGILFVGIFVGLSVGYSVGRFVVGALLGRGEG